MAMPKGNGMEAIIRQTAELGVSRIVPLWSERTVIKPNTAVGAVKLGRWLKIAQEMCEQSHRAYVPQICEPQTLDSFFQNFLPNFFPNFSLPSNDDPQFGKYIGVTTKPAPHLLNFLQNQELPSKIVILIGAEGGWSENETAMAIAHNFQPISLGAHILAAVTAPVVALSIISAIFESQLDF